MFLLILFLLFIPKTVHALYDPLSYANNKYGIHVVDTNELPEIPTLVNSAGGDWGKVMSGPGLLNKMLLHR